MNINKLKSITLISKYITGFLWYFHYFIIKFYSLINTFFCFIYRFFIFESTWIYKPNLIILINCLFNYHYI